MVDFTTRYCGLTLKNPLVPSSGPLTGNLDDARRLEDAGAAALILPSLFEEELIHEQEQLHRFMDMQDIGHHEADSFLPTVHPCASRLDRMLETIVRYKQSLSIPVVASLNGVTDSGWIEYAQEILDAVDRVPLLQNAAGQGNFSPRPDWRPLTKYERRGLNLGHRVFDILAYRT